MAKTTFRYLLLLCVLIPLQAVVFNHLVLFNCAVPLAFVYLIICLPAALSTNKSLTAGFVVGLLVDIFSDTYGINALACTILAFMRKPVMHLYVSREEEASPELSTMSTLGAVTFMKYALTMSLIYCLLMFTIEAFGFFDPERLLIRAGASTIYTFIVISAISGLSASKREKKL